MGGESKPIKLFVFDLGRVILPFEIKPIIPTLHAYSRRKNELTVADMQAELFDWFTGSYIPYETGEISTERFFSDVVKRFDLEMTIEQFSAMWNGIFSEDQKVCGLIKRLKSKGYPLFLLSNTNELHFDYVLGSFPIVAEFDELILSYKLGTRKPLRSIYEEIFKRAHVQPSEVLFIDDMEENVAAAAEMGIRTHHFKGADGLLELLRSEGID